MPTDKNDKTDPVSNSRPSSVGLPRHPWAPPLGLLQTQKQRKRAIHDRGTAKPAASAKSRSGERTYQKFAGVDESMSLEFMDGTCLPRPSLPHMAKANGPCGGPIDEKGESRKETAGETGWQSGGRILFLSPRYFLPTPARLAVGQLGPLGLEPRTNRL